jgi:GTP-binding protein Era
MPETRCGYVAIVGAPNAGKSTLLNTLVGAKVAIVTPKVQTTRSRIIAIAVEGSVQFVFVDTPGIFAPRRRLDRAMVQAAWAGAGDADAVVVLVDAAHYNASHVAPILDGLRQLRRPPILALNKVDAAEKQRLLTLVAELNARAKFSDTFMLSALTGDGTADLRRRLAELMPWGPWLYPEDQLADMPERMLAAEITREQLFLRLHQEVPYGLMVETEAWEDRKDGSVKINQAIHVARDAHKPIVLGQGGRTLKAIGAEARAEMGRAFDRRVHLFLFVRVTEGWAEDPEHYRALGLEFPKS